MPSAAIASWSGRSTCRKASDLVRDRILLVGATGLLGRRVVERLLDRDDIALNLLTRRPIGRTHPALTEQAAPSERWPELAATGAVDTVISTLGTTMRQAGSREAFRAVDHDLVLGVARAARAAGACRMICVTSAGANPASANFYLKVKGETERALGDLDFDRLDLVQPSLLLGARGGPPRFAERFAALLSPLGNLLLRGPLDRFAAIEADIVAEAIVALLDRTSPGRFRHENRDLRRLASG